MAELIGYQENPSALLAQALQRVNDSQMAGLPLSMANVAVGCHGMELYEGQWLGVVVTPWMLSVVILPGPDQCWDTRAIGDRVGLQFPCGDLVFTANELEGVGAYLACSLMSPLDPNVTTQSATQLALDCLRMLQALPVKERYDGPDLSRRALFTGRRACGSQPS
jgi:[NiFe] hydrogenase assembly HybE family chaperone